MANTFVNHLQTNCPERGVKKTKTILKNVALLAASLLLITTSFEGFAQLNSGDIAFVQYNSDGSADEFAFVALTDIAGGEVIYFSENEPTSTTSMNSGEGILTWTAPGGGVACGTVVTLDASPTTSHGSVTETGSWANSTSGDGIWAFQGTSTTAVTTWLAAIGMDSNNGITTTNEGNIANTTLTVGTNAIGINEVDNAMYNGITTGTAGALLAAINTEANWTTSNTANQTFSGSFSVTGCGTPSNCMGQMSGTYTINAGLAASCTNYQDFASAISDMVSGSRSDDNDYRHDGGIDGAVVFEVATDTYTERVSISAVTGASGTNTITFRSASGTNTDVTLNFASSTVLGDPNYVFRFNGADYVSLEDMTIHRTGSNLYSRVIDFSGDASNNTIDNCILTGITTIQTSDYPAVIMNQSSSVQANNVITNCEIQNGSYGMHVECDNGTRWTGFQVTDNTFTNQRRQGIYFEDMDDLIITGNSFSTNSVYTSYQGIYLLDCEADHTISNNDMVASSASGRMQYGIYMSQSIGNHTITNNYIYTTGSGTINYGIYLTGSGGSSAPNGTIANNSVQVVNGSSSSYGLNLSNSKYHDVLNNTFYVSGGTSGATYPFYTTNTSDPANLKNNVFVNEATATTSTANRAIYVSSATAFTSGVSDNAYYTANTGSPFRGRWGSDYTTFAAYTGANGESGTPQNVDPIMNFVGGTGWKATENSLTNGAPQLTGITLDIDGTARYNPTTIGAHENGTGTTPPVADFSASSTTTCMATTVTFTDASINTPTSWAWVFAPTTVTYVGATSSSSQNPQVQFNSPGLYTVTLTATNADGNDDEVKTDYIAVGLNGTYTIGGTTPDYATFTAAVTELNAVGVCGPVVFDVRTGSYTEQISIDQFTGSSATNTVIFQSESGTNTDVTLDFASSTNFGDPNYVVQYNGCDYVTFQNMTIERTGTNTYSRVFDVSGDASNNTITGNILEGRGTTPSGGNSEVVHSDDANTGNLNNTVSNNTITGGYSGIHWEGTSSLTESDLTIDGNTIQSYRYGMYLRYVDEVVITDNTITNPASFNSAATQGIYMFGLDGNLTVTGNNIALKSGTNVTGIDMLSCVGSGANVGLIANNMISVGSSSSESSAGAGDGTGTTEGIYLNATTFKNFYHNSFLSTSTNPTTGRAFYINGPSGAVVNLRNNIFAQNGGGFTLYNSVTSAVSVSDYNDFYATGGSLFAHWGSNVANLAALQAASSQDANSVAADPLFVSNTDLHVGAGTGVDALATTGLGITTDIDGDTRDVSTPDIGADEYDNLLPVVSLSADVNTGTEAAGTVITLTATASIAVTGDQTVDIAITGTGITGTDYTLSGATITILNGQTTGSVTFTVLDDSDAEGDEVATATIGNPSAGVVISAGADSEDLTIVDNDICGTETFVNSPNTGSYGTMNWTGDNSVDWTSTDSRGDQDLAGDEAVMLRNGSLTNDVSQPNGCGTISFDYARIYSNNSTLQVYINGVQYGGDITVSSTSPTTFSTVVNVSGNIDIELRNAGNRTLISNLTWTCFDGPVITVLVTSLNGFVYSFGSGPSAVQSFTVEGASLTNDISIAAPTNYEISTSNSPFTPTDPITLTESGGTVSTTTIYVRLASGLAVGAYDNQDIACTSTGAVTQNVECNGDVITAQTITTSAISGSPYCVGNGATAAVSVPYTITGTFNGPNVFTAQLSDAAGSFASPTNIGTLASTTSGTILATIPASVTAGTGYRIRVVSDDPAITGTDNGTDLEVQNFAAPTALAAVCGSEEADLSWTNPACFDEVLLVASSSSFTATLPTGDGTAYTANLTYGSGTAFDGGFVVYKGTGTASGTITTLTNNTAYNFKIFARIGTNWVAGSTESCTPQTDIFVSEYLEGSSSNKAIELFNGTGSSVDLSNYEIRIYTNGSASVSSTISLSGTLAQNNVYVIANPGADAAIITVADQTSGSLNFNGDDAVVLYNTSTSSYADIIGNIACDPGSSWSSGSHATADKTLVRKVTVCKGVDTDPTATCPFPTLVSEWNVFNQDDFSHLGAHSGCNEVIDITTGTVSSPPFALTSCTDTETGTVAFTSNGTFNAGNIYTAQLSDENGNFDSPTAIGTLTSTANSGTINITIPGGTVAGTGYQIRVVSSDPDVFGTESTAFTVTTTCTPQVLEAGDLAILAFNTNVDGSFGYDEISFVSFVNILPGTVIDFTDNAFEKCGTTNGWGISEGWFRLVRTTSTLAAGKIVTVQVQYGNATVIAPDNNWTASKPQPLGQGNFDLNADGEQMFILSGGEVGGPGLSTPASDAGTYSGDVLYGFNTKGNIWTPVCGNAAAGGTKNSEKPVDFDCFLVWPTAQADKNKYTGPMTPASQRDWLYRINTSSNWTGYADNTSYEAGPEFIDFNLAPPVNDGRTISITSGGFSAGLWTGETDDNWNNCRNWQSLRVPDTDTDVTIPFTANNPHINTAESGICNTIDIDSDNGAKLYIDGTGTFQVTAP